MTDCVKGKSTKMAAVFPISEERALIACRRAKEEVGGVCDIANINSDKQVPQLDTISLTLTLRLFLVVMQSVWTEH